MIQIIPSMLVSDEETFKKQITAILGAVKMVQIDLADGKFVPNTTWPFENPKRAQGIADIDFELHLMVCDPLKVLEDWKDNPHLKRILFHYEATTDVRSILKSEIINLKSEIELGLVLNPPTPVSVVQEYMDSIDAIMFMGVVPGKQGQKFIPETLERIKEFKSKGTNHFIEVDGAVNLDTLPGLIKAGADAVCPGSAVFGNDRSPKMNVKKMEEIINKLTK
jgi:ribulose-phosphate 3-epimerase